MKRVFYYLVILIATFVSNAVLAQTVIQATRSSSAGYLYNSASAAGSFVFGVKNNNATDIVVTTIGNAVNGSFTGNITLWYKSGTVTGAPGPIATTNGWDSVTTVSVNNPGAGTYIDDLFSGLNITIPAGATYRFAMSGPAYSPFYLAAGNNSSNSYISGGVEITTQDNSTSPGYGGAFPSPANTPRGTIVKLVFNATNACTGTPNAGNAIVYVGDKSQSWICGGGSFTLNLSGNSSGTGLTYRWQSSTDDVNWSTYISSASSLPTLTTTQAAAKMFYRAEVTCGADVAYSNSVAVSRLSSLSGTYTINPLSPTSGTNFQTFEDVANAFNCGISGPVVFNVQPGSAFNLTAPLVFNGVSGASAVNTITFNGNGANINYNTSTSASRTALLLDGAKYFIIDSFNIDVSAGTYGWGIQLTGQADNNVIRKNTIIASKTITSANSAGIIVSGSTTGATTLGDNGNNNLIENNKIVGGYYGMTVVGASATPGTGNIVRNNILEDYYLYGIYNYYQTGLLVKGNDISRPTRTSSGSLATYSAIYLTTGVVGATIDGNKIHHLFSGMLTSTSTHSAIALATDGTSANPNRVINNLIYAIDGNGTFYGIYNSGSAYMKAYHNTIALDYTAATAGTTYGFYQGTNVDGIEFINNIIYITRGGTSVKYGIYKSTAATPLVSNYNVFYLNSAGSGAQHVGYQSAVQTTLDNWRTTSGQDANSVYINPQFTAPGSDYTPMETSINNIGTNVGVTTDIIGAARSISPDPGAYEFDVVGVDAAITWVSPTLPAAMGSTPIRVKISNVATATISSVNLSYTDGNNQVTQAFGGLNVAAGADTTLEFTTPYNITGNVRLRAFINLTNGAPDLNQLNDSTDVQFVCFPLNGSYTINSTTPTGGTNFASFADAAAALNCGGVTGPVVLNVTVGTGPYMNDRMALMQINGASASNTITINGNGETLMYSSNDNNARAAIELNGTDHLIIDSLTIDGATGGGTYSWGVLFTNRADSNIIRNSDIRVSSTSTTSANHIAIVMSGSTTSQTTSGNNANYNRIINNTLTGGYHGMYLYGLSTAGSQNVGNVISNNTIKDFYQYGIYELGQAQSVISGNDISRPGRSSSTTTAGIYLSTGVTSTTVNNNRIHNMFDVVGTNSSTFYGIYLGSDATAGNAMNVYNNAVYNIAISTGIQYGIYNTGASYTNIYHNTLVFDDVASSTSSVTRGFYQGTAANNINFKNNIISITRGGTGIKTAMYFGTATSSIASDNNSLYVSGSGTNYIGYFDGNNFAAIADWKTANSGAYDQASVSADPMFTSVFTGELIPTDAAINNLGVPVGVTADIIGAPRSATTPDPGAFEFDVAGIDASIAWVSPLTPGVAGANVITVAVSNTSSTGNITSLKLGYTDGTTVVSQTFTGLSIAPAGSQNFVFTTPYNVTRLVQLQAYIELVNGSPDISAANDTAFQVLCAPLSGTYSLNNVMPSSATNFMSFNEAAAALACSGIAGPVVFEVEPGTSNNLTEQVVIPQVVGASATNTITFKGNGTSVTYNATATGTRSAFLLDGADHIIIDSLNINVSGGTTYGWGITLTGQADSNVIRKCTVTTSISSTSSNYAGIVISGSTTTATTAGNNGSGNLIDSNKIVGGYYGIITVAATATPNSNNVISNNTIEDYYYYGIYTNYQTGVTIKSNNISRPSRTNAISSTTSAAIYITTGTSGALVDGNKIHHLFTNVTTASSHCGIYINSDGSLAAPNRLVNNLMHSIEGNGTFYGISNSGAAYMQAYHNTISLDYTAATAGTTYGFYQSTSADGIEFKNNIVYITRGGSGAKYCIYKSTAATPLVSNNNVFYIVTSVSGPIQAVGYQSSARTTLADWQAASGQDANSIYADPLFVAPGVDFTPQETMVDDLGAPLGVTVDINGNSRSLSSPDPGAYEIPAVAGIDIRPEVLVSPATSENNCYSAETITVKIKNNSQNTIDFLANPLTVAVDVTGPITGSFNTVLNAGTLASGASQDVVVTIPSGTIDMDVTGTYSFKIRTTVTGDVNVGNDTLTVTRTRETLSGGITLATPSNYCINGGMPTLISNAVAGYSSIIWQQSTSPGTGYTNIVGASTNPYVVGSPITQTMYYRIAATCGSNTVYSIEDTVVLNNPQVTSTTNSYTCGPGVVNLNATGTGTVINWYTTPTGGTPIATGNDFTTPVITNTTTYYAANSNGVGVISAGFANAVSTTGYTLEAGLFFDAFTTFTIDGVYVYPIGTGAGDVVIALQNGNVSPAVTLQTITVNLTGTGSPYVKTYVPLNFTVVPGTNYKLMMMSRSGNVTSLVRESGTSWGVYPLTVPGVLSITNGNCCSGNSTITSYYYFYDWKVSTGCESPRVAVTATVNNDPTCVPLPVGLLSFSGNKEAEVHVLRWQTGTETNNTGFELERSSDGINFEQIAFVASKANRGNSSVKLDYMFRDTRPMMGNNFYRLKQIDMNGKTTYSGIVLLNKAGKGLFVKTLYPNPVMRELKVQLETSAADKVTLQVTDLSGKILMQVNEQLPSGTTTIPMNVSGLANGSYFLKVICSSGCETPVSKFVKF